jgi:hypothetical protein
MPTLIDGHTCQSEKTAKFKLGEFKNNNVLWFHMMQQF